MGRQRRGQVVEHRAQAARDLHLPGAVRADLVTRHLDEILPVRRTVDDARPAVQVADGFAAEVTPADHPQQPVHLVDDEHASGRVVDRRGQGFEGDVHQDPEREHRILFHRPLGAEGDRCAKPRVSDLYAASVQHEERLAEGDEVADLRHELDDSMASDCFAEQRFQVNRKHHR